MNDERRVPSERLHKMVGFDECFYREMYKLQYRNTDMRVTAYYPVS